MKALGFDVPKSEILSILASHGENLPSASQPIRQRQAAFGNPQARDQFQGKRVISMDSFRRLMAQKVIARDPRDEVLRAFALFDQEGKGRITLEDLRRVTRELGENIEEEEMAAMIEEFDLEGKGGVTEEEFLGICLH